MRFCNWIFHEARFFDWNLFKPDYSLAFLKCTLKDFFPLSKTISQTMGNTQHTFLSMLFTFPIKPKQDKNINLSNFPLKIKFHVL